MPRNVHVHVWILKGVPFVKCLVLCTFVSHSECLHMFTASYTERLTFLKAGDMFPHITFLKVDCIFPHRRFWRFIVPFRTQLFWRLMASSRTTHVVLLGLSTQTFPIRWHLPIRNVFGYFNVSSFQADTSPYIYIFSHRSFCNTRQLTGSICEDKNHRDTS